MSKIIEFNEFIHDKIYTDSMPPRFFRITIKDDWFQLIRICGAISDSVVNRIGKLRTKESRIIIILFPFNWSSTTQLLLKLSVNQSVNSIRMKWLWWSLKSGHQHAFLLWYRLTFIIKFFIINAYNDYWDRASNVYKVFVLHLCLWATEFPAQIAIIIIVCATISSITIISRSKIVR